ncbi:hypothetical protein F5J12DRAFT_702651, partial [Pisolithus orientalis]|uniref:uncharacterized protein n=1 Tax=Pisolithus orientalis TaxID=936130 RepID=UPI00222561E6
EPSDLLEKIAKQFQLNKKQWLSFQIIADHFIQAHVKQLKSQQQLSMQMTGPGGTGKMHVVKAVQHVMDYYCCGHLICFLAPTGSAASLIDGMTVHKALGIR